MEERNPKIMIAGMAGLLIIVAFFWILSTGKIGLFGFQLESASRKTQQVENSWQSIRAEEGSLTTLLFYNEDRDDYIYSLYINPPGFSFGYFFVAGGSEASIGDGVLAVSYSSGESETYALLSMNADQVARVDMNSGDEITHIELDPAEPFAVVLPSSSNLDGVTMYDLNGQPVAYKETVHQR